MTFIVKISKLNKKKNINSIIWYYPVITFAV